MVQWHLRSKQKPTGAKYKRLRKKKRFERGRDYIPTHLGETKIRKSDKKNIVLSTNVANLMIDNKAVKAKILSVVENPSNPQFVRRNIITKGAIIETEFGKAKVTSRPGRAGAIDAILIEKK